MSSRSPWEIGQRLSLFPLERIYQLPLDQQQITVVGDSASMIEALFLRFAQNALQMGWQVIFLDTHPSRARAIRFACTALQAQAQQVTISAPNILKERIQQHPFIWNNQLLQVETLLPEEFPLPNQKQRAFYVSVEDEWHCSPLPNILQGLRIASPGDRCLLLLHDPLEILSSSELLTLQLHSDANQNCFCWSTYSISHFLQDQASHLKKSKHLFLLNNTPEVFDLFEHFHIPTSVSHLSSQGSLRHWYPQAYLHMEEQQAFLLHLTQATIFYPELLAALTEHLLPITNFEV